MNSKLGPQAKGSLLNAGERGAFARWLDRTRQARGVSKSALSKALGAKYKGPFQADQYLKGRVMPRPKTLDQLAQVLRLPRALMYARAGYLYLLVRALPKLYDLGCEQLARDGLPLDPEWGGAAVLEPPGLDLEDDSQYRNLSLPTLRAEQFLSVSVPNPIYDAFHFAIASFPRRADYYSPFGFEGDLQAGNRIGEALDLAGFDFDAPIKLPTTLRIAVQFLKYSELPGDTRRLIAGELTLAWALNVAPKLAEMVLRSVYAVHADEYAMTLPMEGHVPGVLLSELLSGRAELRTKGVQIDEGQGK